MRAQYVMHIRLRARILVAEFVGCVRRVAMMPHPTLHPASRREIELRGARGPPPARGAIVLIDAQRGAVEAARALRLSRWMARRDSSLRCFRLRDGQEGPRFNWRDRRYCAGHAAEPRLDAPLRWHDVARAAEETPDHGAEEGRTRADVEVREGRTRGRRGTILMT